MRIDIMTLFPDSVDAMLNVSILGRAQQRGYISIQSHQIRQYTTNRQMQVDDYPYGGGRGAVMQADPLYRCWSHIVETYGPGRTIFLSPCGRTFTQEVAKELKARYDHLILVCGHYEGVDQRFLDECVDEEISMGDFVLTGGEIPAMAVADAVCRMVPGVLPDAECFEEESHWNGLLEYPQYSRPAEWHGRAVPEILLSGDHGKVAAWRKSRATSALWNGGRTCLPNSINPNSPPRQTKRSWRRLRRSLSQSIRIVPPSARSPELSVSPIGVQTEQSRTGKTRAALGFYSFTSQPWRP